MAAVSPFSIRNVRLFIAFRIFFNARFYYPVFTILFLDYGLTIESFAVLNAVWAGTIVLFEVPSGALADVMGRRNLLVTAAVIMVAEMALLTFAPRGEPLLLLIFFTANRILSGAAEAAASGADEAIAYDSLAREGDAKDWGKVLERQMRLQSAAFILSMLIGAAVYDPQMVNRIGGWLGLGLNLTQETTLRFPPFLTLLMSLMTLATTLMMVEVPPQKKEEDPDFAGAIPEQKSGTSFKEAFALTFKAGRWILKTPFALVLILSGLLFDHIVRMLLTLSSEYYRIIDLPEATFGIIGSGLSVAGLFVPWISMKLAEKHTPLFNLLLLTVITIGSLFGMAMFISHYGVLFMLVLFSVMLMANFFLSHYLNRITDARQRATVLSFRGLSYNLAYGIVGLLYAWLMAALREGRSGALSGQALENTIFRESITFFPWYFMAAAILFFGLFAYLMRGARQHRQKG